MERFLARCPAERAAHPRPPEPHTDDERRPAVSVATYTEIEPLGRIAYTLEWEPFAGMNAMPATHVQVDFSERAGKTEVQLRHTGLVADEMKENTHLSDRRGVAMKPITVRRNINAPIDVVFNTLAGIGQFSEALPHVVRFEFLIVNRESAPGSVKRG